MVVGAAVGAVVVATTAVVVVVVVTLVVPAGVGAGVRGSASPPIVNAGPFTPPTTHKHTHNQSTTHNSHPTPLTQICLQWPARAQQTRVGLYRVAQTVLPTNTHTHTHKQTNFSTYTLARSLRHVQAQLTVRQDAFEHVNIFCAAQTHHQQRESHIHKQY